MHTGRSMIRRRVGHQVHGEWSRLSQASTIFATGCGNRSQWGKDAAGKACGAVNFMAHVFARRTN
jgi:hypothetical protein